MPVTKITEAEFARIVDGILDDRDSIIKHNPLGTDEEILLWMLLNCIVFYLNLDDVETSCLNGKPDAETYRDAIEFVLRERRLENFDMENYLSQLQ